jgi:alanine-glyoxylate transaminase/serine-glyoxylate transaminase/serine-pyruvate transaminase
MIPGPVELDGEVLREMSRPLVAHYGAEWVRDYKETIGLLQRIFQTGGDLFPIPGSGSAGLDAAIGSLIGDGSKATILSNGFFGQRLVAIAHAYSPHVQVIEGALDRAIPPERLEEALHDPDVKVVAAVHCETSTGVLNPIRDYGELCRRHGAILVVDAISSLGGTELRFDEWNLGICVSAAQKGLEASPGAALVAVSPAAWEQISGSSSPGWYLNLRTWREFAESWADWHPYPVTLPISLLFALKKSLENILEEGLEERFARHERMAFLLRQGLENLGFQLFVPEGHRSSTVTAVLSSSVISAEKVIHFLKQERGIQIGSGIDELRGKIFRIGHMGPQATLDMILPLLFGIEEALRAAGLPIEPGQSLRGIEVKAGTG